MNTTNYIRIFRGDDSDALGYQTIVGTIKTDIDLAGCKAVFRFLGFYAEFDPIPEDRKLTIVIPAQASRGFPPGVGYASLKVIDAYGKIRTFTNRIPVIVDTMTPSCGCGEFEVSFSPFPELEPLKIFIGPNTDDFDQYTGFVSKIIDRASLVKYGLVILADAMGEDGGASGKAASPLAVKAAYDAIIKELVDNYYTAEQTEEAIDRVAAYYITYTAAGAAFPTYSALSNATTVYSGGKVRIPTRNDYCVVLADETHGGAEYRYIYAVAEGETTGSWQPQFPVEGVMTVDQTVQKNSQNPVSGGGIWSMLWGALAALPTGVTSLYDWVVAQLAGKASTADATLTERGFSEWTITPATYEGHPLSIEEVYTEEGSVFRLVANGIAVDAADAPHNTLSLSYNSYGITATRTALPGYQLGSQTTKPVASEAEAEALRTAIATLAPDWVSGSSYAQYDVVRYNGVYYYAKSDISNSTTAPSSDTTNWGSLANLAALAHHFLPLTGGTMTGELYVPVITPTDGTTSPQWYGNSTAIHAQHKFAIQLDDGTRVTWMNDIASAFSTSSTYALNALCVYKGILYRCTTAITTAEAWTPAHWITATVEDVLAALRTAIAAKQDALTQAQLDNIAAVPNKANASDVPYSLGTPTIIDTASSETVEGETVYYGAATLADRTANIVQVTAATALDELRITFPAATSGKVRDFGLRVEIGTGSAALTAPALVPVAPTGETIKIENAGRAIPELADGTATAKGVTLLYFSENAPGVFVVKGEQVEEVA